MAARRAFYVTQGSLTVWEHAGGELREVQVFADSDSGLREFDAYLAAAGAETAFVLLDVIEEEFSPDTVPKLGFRDRRALLQRRLQRKFPRTAYRLPIYQGRKSGGSEEALVVHSAVTNHELLDPWLQIMSNHEVPLTGIFSVPLMAPQLLRHFFKGSGPVLLLTQHQGQKLRQVFVHNSHVQSARLSQSPDASDATYPEFVLTEIGRSRRYLERTRLLSSMEQLDVYIITEGDVAEQILQQAQSDSPLQIHFVRPDVAATRTGVGTIPQSDRLESLYLALAFRRRPKYSYACSGESRYWHMRRLRHAIIGSAVAAAAACSVAAALLLSDAWLLKNHSAKIEDQLAQLTETFRRENERFDPIKADSHEMKVAVDTGDFILANRLPVPWVLQQLGFVMGGFPDVQIQTLGWSAESAAAANPAQQRRGEAPMPVPVPAITAVSAEITASISPFDGDMRKAFARIDALAAELRERTAFSEAVVVEYPLDARPQASIAGEIIGKNKVESASFRLRLRLPLQTENVEAGMNDESV